jgi:hypothetical protein
LGGASVGRGATNGRSARPAAHPSFNVCRSLAKRCGCCAVGAPSSGVSGIDARQRDHGVWGLIAGDRSSGDIRLLEESLLDAPRVEAVPAPQVDEAIHARGDVNVRARALVARRQRLSRHAPLDGSILRSHNGAGEAHHHTLRLSSSRRGARRPGAPLFSGRVRDG